jgi:cytochrome c oxidase accessory protein FixG
MSSWTTKKITKKMVKWTIFWVVSFLIANTFLSYIIGVDELFKIMTEPISKHLGGFGAIVIFTSIFFFVYSWFREQVCTVVCPYGRMQGVLLDRNSLVVAYDYTRGEKRGKLKKNIERSDGDCVDCLQCVRVCPTGIDIRNGTQLECINCTACIDACDHMMKAVGFDTGLIRLASENNIATKKPFRLTSRIKAYSVVMCLLLGVLVFLLASRSDVGITLLRTPGQMFQKQPDHQLSNLYNYKFLNKTYIDKELTLRPENFTGELRIVGDNRLFIPKENFTSGSMFIILKEEDVTKRKTQLKIGVYEGNKKIETITTSFLGPFNGK